MPLLSQVIGHAQDSKKRVKALMTQVYHTLQKASVYTGLQRTYRPMMEGGTEYPPETSIVQTTVPRELLSVVGDLYNGPLTEYINESLTLNAGNAEVKVDVKVGDRVVFAKVPPTFLMEMKTLLTDLNTMVSKLPTLDPATQWAFNTNSGVWESLPTETIKTQKTKRFLSVAKATDKHPEQVQVWDEDQPIGYWKKVDLSGAIPLPVRNELVERVVTLQKAVDNALAEANAMTVQVRKDGGMDMVNYIFQDLLSY